MKPPSNPRRTRRVPGWFVGLFALLCGGSAVFGVLTARRDAAQAYNERAPAYAPQGKYIPDYPGARFYPLGDSLSTEGVERQLGYALTPDLPHKVASRYEGIWHSQGLTVERRRSRDLPEVPMDREEEWVSATHPNEPFVRLVGAIRKGQETIILASVRAANALPGDVDVPRPQECAMGFEDGGKDGGVRTEQVSYVCALPLDEVQGFYDRLMFGAIRKVQLGQDGSARELYVSYRAATRHVTVIASELAPEADGKPRTSLHLTWQEQE